MSHHVITSHYVTSPVAADGRHALPENRGRPRVDVRQALEGWRAVPRGGGGRYHRGEVRPIILLPGINILYFIYYVCTIYNWKTLRALS